MAQLAIANSFMPQYARLEPKVRKGVEATFAKFAEHTYAGLHLEKIHNSRDPRIRTIRIDQFWRGVVLAPERGDVHCLLAVLPHDEAIAWARSRKFTVNQRLGVLEVRDQAALDEMSPALSKAAEGTAFRLFGHVFDKDLIKLGIDADLIPLVRLLTTEAHLQALERRLPEPQYIALLALAQGMNVQQAWEEVAKSLSCEERPASVDPDDLVAAMRRTPGQVAFVNGPEELRDILAHPFDTWRIFLHPVQRQIALRPSYSGPAQVTGGAGTGKTVTALHRARLLASKGDATRVLLTTYTTNLAQALEAQLALLIEDERVRERIHVRNVDAIAYGIVGRHRRPNIAGGEVLEPLWTEAAEQTPYSPTFLNREWEQVILAQGLESEADYLTCTRTGRGVPLGQGKRSTVWKAVQQVVDRLKAEEKSTFPQLANEAAELVGGPEYDHVILDEAQDIHPTQWRLLRRLVAEGPDDLFIVGDPHQRIYDSHVSLASLGINVRGRSSKLKLNYRTTQEILTWSVSLLGLSPAQGLDDSADTLDGYRSPMHGRRPTVTAYDDQEAELDGLVRQVRSWLDEGVEPATIGVAARYKYMVRKAVERLKADGVKAFQVPSKSAGVQVGTMHRMKGLEFRCIAVIGADDHSLPSSRAVTPEAEDPKAHAQDVQKERCLLFVACTRARDRLAVSYTASASPFLP
ncbi:UvrD-helicase domain-containing protein [Actinomadura litoris]|uniref:DNA 3'-5' helicase n=1 Tax=Actinomadura litoris TaxID=2678616 RepID=A0A7K1KWE2_9ACTN|nr:AAA family ATPase [Actinomadura litoris]